MSDEINDLVEARRGISRTLGEANDQGMWFRIIDVAGTALSCIAGTVADTGPEFIYTIALPDDLTATAWPGGVTVTHTDVNNASATDGTTAEDWKMTKAYAVGNSIRARFWDDGRWIDDNIAGRMWAAVPVVSGGGG